MIAEKAFDPKKEFLYFAYGSNMLTRRLTTPKRAPSAVPLDGVAFVTGRKLTFSKASKDGSGKCDAELSGHDQDCTYGVLYVIKVSDKHNLDRAEGDGKGYQRQDVEVLHGSVRKTAVTYIATEKDPILKPYDWYKALVIAGAREHGLPSGYIKGIAAFPSIPDLNDQRRKKNEGILLAGTS